nr:hypothetical protein GCM10020092_102270 [Actinoplanes digitatis]
MSAALATATPSPARRLIGGLVRTRELGIILALAALVGYTAAGNPRFLSGQSIRDILLNTAILAVMAAGQAVVVITRNIDLSVGSVLGLSAFAVATMMSANPGLPMVVAILAGLAIGGVAGLVNGVLVRFGRVLSPGGHARHALHLPRHHLLLGGRPAGERRRTAPALPDLRQRLVPRLPAVAGADRADRGRRRLGADA